MPDGLHIKQLAALHPILNLLDTTTTRIAPGDHRRPLAVALAQRLIRRYGQAKAPPTTDPAGPAWHIILYLFIAKESSRSVAADNLLAAGSAAPMVSWIRELAARSIVVCKAAHRDIPKQLHLSDAAHEQVCALLIGWQGGLLSLDPIT